MFSWCGKLRLVQYRTVWCPTFLGLLCVFGIVVIPVAWWCYYGESFLSSTNRLPAEVLVVEGWIGRDGVRAAAAEFGRYRYQYIVTTGGVTKTEGWDQGGWSYAEGAEHELIRLGVPVGQIIVAPARDAERQRTFESAVATCRALCAKGIRPKALNVFTWGPHAKRSRLVFAKVNQPETSVGVVSWAPSIYRTEPWWRSSDRAKELLTETAGYVYEALFGSGRSSNSGGADALHGLGRPGALVTRFAGP